MRTSGTARVLASLLVVLRVIALLVGLAVLVQVVRGEPLGIDMVLSAPRSVGAVMTTSATPQQEQEAVAPLGRRELRLHLQELLAHDTMLTIRFMRATVSDDPGFVDAANAVVVRSRADIEQGLARALPGDSAAELADQWATHNQHLFAYATALRDGDDPAREDARAQLATAARTQAAVLSELAGGGLTEDAAATSLQMRNDLLLYQVEAYADDDYEQAYALTHEAYEHASSLAATIAAAAHGRDPHDIDVAPREQLRSDLTRVLGEHVELTTDTLRTAVAGDAEFEAATAALDRNGGALSDLIAGAVGNGAARKPARLWAANVDQQLRYALAVADQDAAARRTIRDKLRGTARRIGAALHDAAGGEGSAAAVAEAVRSQQVLQLDQIDAYARGDYASAIDTASTAHHRVTDLARMLTDALLPAVRDRMPAGGADTGGGGTADDR